ncbi:MAG: biotin/lipoyl-binding protein [Anaerolineales bacterium]|nr:biotin/lipoyl-binding protein [Anaerolineales bacterium]
MTTTGNGQAAGSACAINTNESDLAMRYITTLSEKEFLVEIIDEHQISLNGKIYAVDFDSICDQPVYSLLIEGRSYEAYVYPGEERGWQVLFHGNSYPALVEDEAEKRLRVATTGGVSMGEEYHLKAPMPGLVVSVHVSEGQEVLKGDVLVVLESMKMQNELKAPRPGVVSRLRVKAGDNVEQHQVMLSVG